MSVPTPRLFSPACGTAPLMTMRHSAKFSSPAPSRCCRRRSRSGQRRRRPLARRDWLAAELWRLRTGHRQNVGVDMRHAAIEFRSERYLRVDGKRPNEYHDDLAGLYRCGDGRFARLHTNLPHHCSGLLKLLGVPHDKEAVQRVLDGMTAEAIETAAAEAGLVVTACRSFAEWDRHPQGQAVAKLPLFSIEKIGDAPPKKLAAAERPLSGVKVLDLTRIIAGPVCGRTLAAHGADVLLITAKHLASMLPLVMDTGRGKLSASIDLREAGGRESLAALVPEADVFVQGYRPGAIAAHGFSPQDVARLRPGIVYASLCAYGNAGPWANRRGFDSAGADRERLQRRRSRSVRFAKAERIADAGARPCPPAICSPSR